MKVVGYADLLSVRPGSSIQFMVSCDSPTYHAEMVRLIHGDVNPDGPGFKSEPLRSGLEGEHPGTVQRLRTGSFVRIPKETVPKVLTGFGVHMWIYPTTPDRERQTLLSHGETFALRLERGRLSLQVGDGQRSTLIVDRVVERNAWYSVAASFDADSGAANLWLDALSPVVPGQATASGSLEPGLASSADDVLIAAENVSDGDETIAGNFYNGKIDAPRLFERALSSAEIAVLRDQDGRAPGLVAAWDFSQDISSSTVTDTSGNGHHGRTVNKPTRAVTGWNWDGSETAWPHAPSQYGAIHFHDDDLDDALWRPSLRWDVPDDTASGVYALRVSTGDAEDFIPFAVRPPRGTRGAEIAFLMPTFSYLAYANEHTAATVGQALLEAGVAASGAAFASYPSTPEDKYVLANGLNSLYDAHSDGSGVFYSSRRRPIVNMRPKVEMALLNDGEGSPHQFNADLHLVDWLHETGYEVDVLTDEDLHREADLLDGYRVVLTGTHCEYWSIEMIRAAQDYLLAGGRMMYLAGNGMYWVTQHDPENGNGIEVRRRGPSSRSSEPAAGESHLSATGELGGIWRYRGITPQSWLGVGFTAQGPGKGRPYERLPGSFDARASWIFEGLSDDERIGDFPCLVNGHGAAGLELDRLDLELGTPAHTHHLAFATGFDDTYQHAVEEVLMSNSAQGGSVNPLVRADMVLLEYPQGGAVWSPGSISWCGCLSHDGYQNNVARITKNVLDGFLRDRPPWSTRASRPSASPRAEWRRSEPSSAHLPYRR